MDEEFSDPAAALDHTERFVRYDMEHADRPVTAYQARLAALWRQSAAIEAALDTYKQTVNGLRIEFRVAIDAEAAKLKDAADEALGKETP